MFSLVTLVTVPDFCKTSFRTSCEKINFLKSIGINQKAFQESYREKWNHPLAHEITIDIIPGLLIFLFFFIFLINSNSSFLYKS